MFIVQGLEKTQITQFMRITALSLQKRKHQLKIASKSRIFIFQR